jgi:DNA-binding transcriptional LysR family regulator
VVAFNMTTNERLRILKVFEVQVGLVCPRGLMPDPPTSIALSDCVRWPLCLPDDALSIRPRLMKEINRQDRSYKIAATSNSIATTCGLIIEGAGVGFMTLADVDAQPEAEKLLFIPLKGRRLTEHISFAVASSFRFEEGLGASLLAIGTFISDITEGRLGAPG